MKPRRNPRKKPAIPARSKLARATASPTSTPLRPEQVIAMRDLFWQNVMREMLTSLAVMWQQLADGPPQSETPSEAPPKAPAEPSSDQQANTPDPALFDGRLGIITRGGDRIAIASIVPLYACGASAPSARDLALAIECTIFQIRTPDGHVFTIPIHEIRSFHALSPEVMQRLERAARRRAARRESDEDAPPFGFAAFTSLTRGSLLPEPPPAHPME